MKLRSRSGMLPRRLDGARWRWPAREPVEIEVRVETPTHFFGIGRGRAEFHRDGGQWVVQVINPGSPPGWPGNPMMPVKVTIRPVR